jgi:hypothetical protein
MKMNSIAWLLLAWTSIFTSCQKEDLTYTSGDIKIQIKAGKNWLHDYPLFLGITKKNPPQFAIWLEDTNGNYISTLYATYKIATESWMSNNGNRRKEALPYWCHKRGIVYPDGLMLPTKNQPLTDGITGATPKGDKEIQLKLKDPNQRYVIKAEFNHSLDFNNFFPENAKEGDENYSGGKEGSGQPAVVYSAIIEPNSKSVNLQLIGRSSSDGTSGTLFTDLEKLSSAKFIVKNISIEIYK